MRNFFVAACIVALALAVPLHDTPYADVATPLNKNVNGTLATASKITIEVDYASDWRFVVFSFDIRQGGTMHGTAVATASVSCGSGSPILSFPLEAYIPVNRNRMESCESKPIVTIENTSTKDFFFNFIAVHVDSSTYLLNNNEFEMGVVPGHSVEEFVGYRGYIGRDGDAASVIDFVNITVLVDRYSNTTIEAYLTTGPRAEDRTRKNLEMVEPGMLLVQVMRSDPIFFCQDCFRFVTVKTKEPGDGPVYFSVSFNVDRGMIHMRDMEEIEITVFPDNRQTHMLIDLTDQVYDTHVYLAGTKLDHPETDLVIDVSLTSYDDGSQDVVASTTLNGVALREWGWSNNEPFFKIGGVYYLRLKCLDATVTEPMTARLKFATTKDIFTPLYYGTKHHYISRDVRSEIKYYRTVIPKEDFGDVKQLTVSMKELRYTSAGGSYLVQFDVYQGRIMSDKHALNIADPSTYVYMEEVRARPEFVVTIAEGQEGWCEDCTWGIAVRTYRETQWLIDVKLETIPFYLRPGEPKKGSIVPHSGGREVIFFYSTKDMSKEVEIACEKLKADADDVVLYVSTTPNASRDNHCLMDNTRADGRAEVTLDGCLDLCNNCNYYVAIFLTTEGQPETPLDAYDTAGTPIELSVNCEDNSCLSCPKPGFDPAQDCKQCLPGHYGSDCKPCDSCHHGKCSDGISGSGSCTCDSGWDISSRCTTCLANYFGMECRACPVCQRGGTCSDGIHGNGTCKCVGNLDPARYCADCLYGFVGKDCVKECPGGHAKPCSGHGVCSMGMGGDGWCTCDQGRVGLLCDTLTADDQCKPHCYPGGGGCDEPNAVCVCRPGFSGKTCNFSRTTLITIITIGGAIAICVIVIVAAVCMFLVKGKGQGGNGESGGKSGGRGSRAPKSAIAEVSGGGKGRGKDGQNVSLLSGGDAYSVV